MKLKTLPIEQREKPVAPAKLVQAAIALVLPFDPKMCGKSETENSLKKLMGDAESKLLQQYPGREILPLLQKLSSEVNRLNYNSLKKSIVLFVSHASEWVCYTDMPVNECVLAGEPFGMKDILRCRKDSREYLVLALEPGRYALFLGKEGNSLRLLLRQDGREARRGLEHLLQSYPLPVFLAGSQPRIRAFLQESRLEHPVAGCLPFSRDTLQEEEINSLLQPQLQQWNTIREKITLNKIKQARLSGLLSWGADQVWDKVCNRNVRALVLESEPVPLLPAAEFLKEAGSAEPGGLVTDFTDALIKKTLEADAEVEYATAGSLRHHGHIALIRRY